MSTRGHRLQWRSSPSLILFRVAMRGLGTPGPVALSSNQQLE